ncbi:hypothetical protein UlMin_021827 [Ulmus minor]
MATPKPLLKDLVSGTNFVPPNFIRPENDRPNLDEVHLCDVSIPLVDLEDLHGPNHSDVINQIAQACQNYGFFQVKNHGIEEAIIENVVRVSREFFHLSESERLKNYSEDPFKTTRLSTSFNVRTEKVSSWRDYLRLHCYPVEEYIDEWPENPKSFKRELLEAISESLGLAGDNIDKKLGKHGQHMAINYYPPCPQPELTYGLPAHADPNVVTVLLQDDVAGLQVLKDGNWLAVKPIPNTFIVNIGDQIQVISNDRYKSVLHRAVVNSSKERISIPTFYCPSYDAVIEPAQQLIDQDNLAHYKSFTYNEYYEKFWDKGLRTHTCLDNFKIYHPKT